MHYFTIDTIKGAIEHLEKHNANWVIPSFVFAANGVSTGELIDISVRLGTDRFLDRYFNGIRIGLPEFDSGNNLLRPRMKGIKWNSGPCAGDFIVRQDTKMWGNLFSSRGYREMRQRGEIEGERTIVRLTDTFQPRFEAEVPSDFQFERFLIWLFAFEGIPDGVNSWDDLLNHLLIDQIGLDEFPEPFRGRFRASNPPPPWPETVEARPSDEDFVRELGQKLWAQINDSPDAPITDSVRAPSTLPDDDPIFLDVKRAIGTRESLAFLLVGVPGTGKTRLARQLAMKLTRDDESKTLFLQFHPAIAYDDFMEGFRPEESENPSGVRYRLGARLFLTFAEKAQLDESNLFVIVIDELNRGDVARVFGEVLTYFEPDYRGIEFTLPISGRTFALPSNLVMIATANPYDRSVTELDDALLRRFWAFELTPDRFQLERHLEDCGVDRSVVDRTLRVFEILNAIMPNGYGHTNFLRVRSLDDLASTWLGRARVVLRRSLEYDRMAFDDAARDIEQLLQLSDEE